MPRAALSFSILGAGLVALLAGLVHLQLVFGAELDEAHASIVRAEVSMHRLVAWEVKAYLAERRVPADERITFAINDRHELLDGVLLFSRGEQVFPPRPVDDDTPRAMDVIAAFEAGALPLDDTPRGERLRLLAALRGGGRDPGSSGSAADTVVRRLLEHLAAHRLAPADELATRVLAVETIAGHPDVDPTFVRTLLGGSGVAIARPKVEGVVEAILKARGTLADEDLTALLDRLEDDARRFRHSLVQARRVMEIPARELRVPSDVAAPSHYARLDGRPAVLWREGGDIRGYFIREDQLQDRLEALKRQRLLPVDAVVELPEADGPIEALAPVITTDTYRQASATAERRYHQKSALVAACAILALVAMGLAGFVVRRRQAFVELKNDFVATVSHELKTPLAAIRLLAETLERKLGDDARARDYPRRIVGETERLSFLVENLLSFNRVDKGRWQLQREAVDVHEVVSDVAGELESHLGGPPAVGIDVAIPEGARLHADAELLRLLFSNLIRNGLAYNEREARRVQVRAESAHVFVVEDNGVGIPAEDRVRVFEPFVRSSHTTTRARRGSGLGLSLCRRILALHGGELVLAESGPEGSRFVCRFPAEAAIADRGDA